MQLQASSAAGKQILPALSAARCTGYEVHACMHAEFGPQLYLNLSCQGGGVKVWPLYAPWIVTGRKGCAAAAMFCQSLRHLGTRPPKAKRWWGRIGDREAMEAISPGKSRPRLTLTCVMTAASILWPSSRSCLAAITTNRSRVSFGQLQSNATTEPFIALDELRKLVTRESRIGR
jgi:hypothetical protein